MTWAPPRGETDLYAVFGVERTATVEELRRAYRRLARQLHPDVSGIDDGGRAMARLNDAWRVLSDPEKRQRYDATTRASAATSGPRPQPSPAPRSAGGPAARPADGRPSHAPPPAGRSTSSAPPGGDRRQAWIVGVQAQMARLTRQAAKSATQTLLVKSPRGARADYEALVDPLVDSVLQDTESRVRAARAAGAAPLDLAWGACLIALRSVADHLRRQAPTGLSLDMIMTAELVDRMWDILAHELRNDVVVALGGNPHVAHAIGVR